MPVIAPAQTDVREGVHPGRAGANQGVPLILEILSETPGHTPDSERSSPRSRIEREAETDFID